MKMVDSSVWIDHWNSRLTPQVHALRLAQYGSDVAVGDLIILEVLQGFRTKRMFNHVLQVFLSYPTLDLGGVELAVKAARNYRFLRSRGFTVRKPIDCLIATFCIENGYELLHSDRDYLPFEEHLGLKSAAV